MLMISIMVENMVTTNTSDNKGEKYLKENASWLGYQIQSPTEKVEKNSYLLEEEAIREDARSNGIRVDAPSYGMQSGVTIQSMQDEFEPGEEV